MSAALRPVLTTPMPSFTAIDVNSGTTMSRVVTEMLDGTSIFSFQWTSGRASTDSTKGSPAMRSRISTIRDSVSSPIDIRISLSLIDSSRGASAGL